MKPRGKPVDLANLIVFLASDEAAYVTGQTIAADGGLMSHMPYHAQVRAEQGANGVNTEGPVGDIVEAASDRKERVSEIIRKKYGR